MAANDLIAMLLNDGDFIKRTEAAEKLRDYGEATQ